MLWQELSNRTYSYSVSTTACNSPNFSRCRSPVCLLSSLIPPVVLQSATYAGLAVLKASTSKSNHPQHSSMLLHLMSRRQVGICTDMSGTLCVSRAAILWVSTHQLLVPRPERSSLRRPIQRLQTNAGTQKIRCLRVSCQTHPLVPNQRIKASVWCHPRYCKHVWH